MKLETILKNIKLDYQINNPQNINIADIQIDSRQITQENTIFFALNGKNSNGEKFIADAIKNGAKIIVANNFYQDNSNITSIKCDDIYGFLINFLQIFYHNLPKNIYAVTGTNGKSSVVEFGRQILDLLNIKSASIGTIGVKTSQKINFHQSSLTTPDIVTFFKNLALLKENNIDDIFIEASSIGLDQKRIFGVKIDVAAFTNFSQDHLDYHKDMQDYFAKKMILFREILSENGTAILNSDIKEFSKITEIITNRKINIIDYGFKAENFKITNIIQNNSSQQFEFIYKKNLYQTEVNISATFQIFNLICALAMVLAKHDINHDQLTKLLKKFTELKSADGRMEKIANFNGAEIFIDFAHSPDALENILKNINKSQKNRLIIIFGCGGDRDNKKRPLMGKIACDYADLIIVTDDNPRNEDPKKIRQEILSACDHKKTVEIENRKKAIEKTLELAKKDDIIIIAGKGHEKYQIIKDKKYKFDEKEIIKNFIEKNNN